MSSAKKDLPSDAAILERARSLCSEGCYTVALQCRRLRSIEPEDKVFVFRPWVDFQFLVVALRRLRRAAEIAARVSSVSVSVKVAIGDFDRKLPNLKKMRNVGEHIDAYAVDDPKRHHGDVSRRHLQVGQWDRYGFIWLGHHLEYETALGAANELFLAVKQASNSLVSALPHKDSPDAKGFIKDT